MRRMLLSPLAFLALTAVVPTVLWVADAGQQLFFGGGYFILTTLGKAAGISGIGLFAGNLILSGRYRWLDRWFGGLDRVYRFHRKIGVAAFMLLSTHVVAISARPAFISWEIFYRSLIDFGDLALNAGRLSYAGLLVIVALTLRLSGKVKYEYLKKMHQFLGAFLFVGGVHAYLIPSDIARNQTLRVYTLGLAGAATASYLWRTVLRKYLVPKTTCTVTAVQPLSDNVTAVSLQPPPEKKIAFLPGQFIFITFQQPGFPAEEHPFSLTAAPSGKLLSIAAKHIGDFTKTLPQLRVGARAKIQGPFGGFSFLLAPGKKQVWIAGGIGVTPFVSMAKALRDGRNATAAYDICMIYSVQQVNDLVFQRELEAIASTSPNFKLIPWITAELGFITAHAVQRFADFSGAEFFLCGPKPMMFALRRQLRTAGVPRAHIHYELFRLL